MNLQIYIFLNSEIAHLPIKLIINKHLKRYKIHFFFLAAPLRHGSRNPFLFEEILAAGAAVRRWSLFPALRSSFLLPSYPLRRFSLFLYLKFYLIILYFVCSRVICFCRLKAVLKLGRYASVEQVTKSYEQFSQKWYFYIYRSLLKLQLWLWLSFRFQLLVFCETCSCQRSNCLISRLCMVGSYGIK